MAALVETFLPYGAVNLSELTQAPSGPRRTVVRSSERWGEGVGVLVDMLPSICSAYYYARPNSRPSKVRSVTGSLVEVSKCGVFWPLCALVEVLLANCYVFWP